MRNCPNCGSSAQVRVIRAEVSSYDTDVDDNNFVIVHKYYICGCGEHFKTSQIFSEIDGEDVIDSWNENEGD